MNKLFIKLFLLSTFFSFQVCRPMEKLFDVCKKGDLRGAKVIIEKEKLSGVRLCKQDRVGCTVLHHAVDSGNLDLVKYLVSVGPVKKAKKPEVKYRQLMEDARSAREEEIETNGEKKEKLKMLVEKDNENLNCENNHGKTPVFFAVKSLLTLKYFIDEKKLDYWNNFSGRVRIWTLLHHIVCDGSLDIVRYLIEVKSINPNIKMDGGDFLGGGCLVPDTPLKVARFGFNNKKERKQAYSAIKYLAKRLITTGEKDVDFEIEDEDLLCLASQMGDVQTVAWLVSNNANTFSRALFRIVKDGIWDYPEKIKSYKKIAEVLIEKEANVNLLTDKNKTLLDWLEVPKLFLGFANDSEEELELKRSRLEKRQESCAELSKVLRDHGAKKYNEFSFAERNCSIM